MRRSHNESISSPAHGTNKAGRAVRTESGPTLTAANTHATEGALSTAPAAAPLAASAPELRMQIRVTTNSQI